MATDKTLDQVKELTDFDYALIVKGKEVSKISKAQLASVVAELIGVANHSNNGLESKDIAFVSKIHYIDVGASIEINCSGLLYLRVPYGWNGFVLYHCSREVSTKLAGNSIPVKVTSDFNGVVTITNESSARLGVQIVYQNIPRVSL